MRALPLLAFLGCSASPPKASAPESVVVTDVADEIYAEVDGYPLFADMALPDTSDPAPVVVLIHGGGFNSGSRTDERVWADWLASQGFAAVAIDYRLTCVPDNGPPCVGSKASADDPGFPGPLQDTKCAVRWLKASAELYNLDPDRIAVLGSSAGAWFSSMLALTADVPELEPVDCPETDGISSGVAAAVDYFGPMDWSSLGLQRRMSGTWGGTPLTVGERALVGSDCIDADDQRCMDASPVRWVSGEDAPLFVTHSSDDPVIPVDQAYEIVEQLDAAGQSAPFLELEAEGHGWSDRFDDPDSREVRDQMLAWLAITLGQP